jgi:transposase
VLKEMCAWLTGCGVTHGAMEATGIYSNPVFHALAEFGGFEVIKCNPAHVKNPVPGRKTGAADCCWLAELLECGLVRGSCVPAQKTAELRDLTRYRARLAGSRTSEIQRLQKTLEDAGIKIGSVACDVPGVSSRAMIKALIDGERRGAVLAGLARGVLRNKIPGLSVALAGRFNDHHALMCKLHLRHTGELTELTGTAGKQNEVMLVPFRPERDLLMTIPGIGPAAPAVILSESGSPGALPRRGPLRRVMWVGHGAPP